jgi:hypothetical protein
LAANELMKQTQVNNRSSVPAGCLYAFSSAIVTCVLLFLNGAIVMAFLRAVANSGAQWARNPRIMQFLLLLIPVILVVLQWMLLDYLRCRFRRTR